MKVNIQKIARRATPFLTALIVLLCCLAPVRAGAAETDSNALMDFCISYAPSEIGWLGSNSGDGFNYIAWNDRKDYVFEYTEHTSFSGFNEVGIALKNRDNSYLMRKGDSGSFSISGITFRVYDGFAEKWKSIVSGLESAFSVTLYFWYSNGAVGSRSVALDFIHVSGGEFGFSCSLPESTGDVVKMVIGLSFDEGVMGSRFEYGVDKLQFVTHSYSSMNFYVDSDYEEPENPGDFYGFNGREYALILDGSEFYRYRVNLKPSDSESVSLQNTITHNSLTVGVGNNLTPILSTPYNLIYKSPLFDCSDFPVRNGFSVNGGLTISGPPDGKGYSYGSRSACVDYYDSAGTLVGSHPVTMEYDSTIGKYTASFDGAPINAYTFRITLTIYDCVFFSKPAYAFIDYLDFEFSVKRDSLKPLAPLPGTDSVIVEIFAEDGKTKLTSFWSSPLGKSTTIELGWKGVRFSHGLDVELWEHDISNPVLKLIPIEVTVQPPYSNYFPILEQNESYMIYGATYLAFKVQRETVPEQFRDSLISGDLGMSGALGNLSGAGDVLSAVPKPKFSASDLVPTDILASADFLSYTAPIKEFWNSGVLSSVTTVLGGILLLSYVLFGEKG